MTEGGYTIKDRIEDLAKTIAEQLSGIVVQLDKIERKLDEKASEADLESLKTHVESNEKRIRVLELALAGNVAVSVFQRRVVQAVGLGGLAAVAELIYLIAKG